MSDATPKVMVNSSGNGDRTVEVTRDTKEMPIDNISNYYEFPSSNVKAFETYSQRIAKLSEALGNTDSVKS